MFCSQKLSSGITSASYYESVELAASLSSSRQPIYLFLANVLKHLNGDIKTETQSDCRGHQRSELVIGTSFEKNNVLLPPCTSQYQSNKSENSAIYNNEKKNQATLTERILFKSNSLKSLAIYLEFSNCSSLDSETNASAAMSSWSLLPLNYTLQPARGPRC